MRVADVQQRIAIKLRRKSWQLDLVLADAYPQRVAPAAAVQADQPQAVTDERVDRIPVFEVKEVGTLAEHLGLVLGLQAQPLSQMHTPNALCKVIVNRLVHVRRFACGGCARGRATELMQ